TMFDVRFRFGGPWDRQADAGPAPVVVLSEAMNQSLFGGADSVGRRLRIDDREFRVVGVMARWRTPVRVYDVNNKWRDPPAAIMGFSLLFLCVCSLNLVALELAKFLAGAPEVGLRRALGARRRDIFVQHLLECELAGLMGGALGAALALGGVGVLNRLARAAYDRDDL